MKATLRRPTPVPQYPSLRARVGFTLIELLVVVAIIVALLALLMPAMGKAMIAASRAREAASTRQVTLICLGYSSDHFGMLPIGQNGTAYNMTWTETSTWEHLRDRYNLPWGDGARGFGCASWEDSNAFWEPNPLTGGDGVQVPWIYWGNRPDIVGPLPMRTYDFMQRTNEATTATSETLFSCYARQTSDQYTSLSPHVNRYGDAGLTTPAGETWTRPDVLCIGYIDGSVRWIGFNEGAFRFTKGANASTFFYAARPGERTMATVPD